MFHSITRSFTPLPEGEVVGAGAGAGVGELVDGAVVTAPEAGALIARYVDTYGVEPTGPFQVNAYDATNMFLDAIEAVGTVDDAGNLVIDRAALAEYIRSIKDFEGLSGNLNCDGTGECSAADIGIVQYQGDEEVQVAVGKPAADGTITIEEEAG